MSNTTITGFAISIVAGVTWDFRRSSVIRKKEDNGVLIFSGLFQSTQDPANTLINTIHHRRMYFKLIGLILAFGIGKRLPAGTPILNRIDWNMSREEFEFSLSFKTVFLQLIPTGIILPVILFDDVRFCVQRPVRGSIRNI